MSVHVVWIRRPLAAGAALEIMMDCCSNIITITMGGGVTHTVAICLWTKTFICPFVTKINLKVLNSFQRNIQEMLTMGEGPDDYMFSLLILSVLERTPTLILPIRISIHACFFVPAMCFNVKETFWNNSLVQWAIKKLLHNCCDRQK